MKLDQSRMPIYEALQQMKRERLVPFDVPGHKHGKGNPELTDFLGEKCMSIDVNSCLLYTSPSPRDVEESRMPSSA